MRRTLLAGVVLAVTTVLVVLVGSAFGLDIESVALLGVALGAVVALVPDRTVATRLGGFGAGFVAAWIGYFLRAALLPDTTPGRAIAAGIVVLLCLGATAASVGRLPLWSTLLGTGAFVGAYEYTYAVAPPELLTSSVNAATSLLLTVAVGFFVAIFFAPAPTAPAPGGHVRTERPPKQDDPNRADSSLDDFMMEKTQ